MTSPPFSPTTLDRARTRIRGSIHRTPLLSSRALTERAGVPVHVKCENLQRTGSFKVRGALHRMLRLTPEERARGVVTISAGNHAQAVAWAASAAGVESIVVMPEGASPTKIRASRGYGAEVVLRGTPSEAFQLAFELAEERGATFVHPFDDPDVVSGHASCMLEIVEDLPDVGTVVVPVGGGGLASGIAAAAAARTPGIAVWGVEPFGADAMYRSLDQGRPVELSEVRTIADGLAAPMAGTLNFEILRDWARGVVRVEEHEIEHALALLLERTKLLVEPAGAAGLAAVLSKRIENLEGPVVVVLSGGNVDLPKLAGILGSAASGLAGADGKP